MSVQKFHGNINTDGIKDERGIETPSLSATGEVAGQTGVFTESVSAPSFVGDLTGTAEKATADAEGNEIPATYATKEALAEEASARAAADETLSKGITAEATERSAAIEDIVDGTTVVGKATADAEGNVIPTTYATQSALSSGLAGKANTSGSYPSLSVGLAANATNATTAANINTAASTSSLWNKSTVLLSGQTIDTANPSAGAVLWATTTLLGWSTSSHNGDRRFVSAMYDAGEGSEAGTCVTGSVIVDPSTKTLTILTGADKGFSWNFTAASAFTTFGGATLPAQVTITVLGFSNAEA